MGLIAWCVAFSAPGGLPPASVSDSAAVAASDSVRAAERAVRQRTSDSVVRALPSARLAALPDSTFVALRSLVDRTSSDSVIRAWLAAYDAVDARRAPARAKREAAKRIAARTTTIRDGTICRGDEKPSRERVARLLAQHPEWDDADLGTVACRHVRIGMTAEMARAAWGPPRDVNRTTYSFGVHEQWVYGEYGSNYLYFEDGRLTSIQN